jgi:hypothetical protein
MSSIAAYPLDATKAFDDATNTVFVDSPLGSLGDASEIVPSKYTVQVMNAHSLNNAQGLFMMTRVNQQLALGGTSGNWDELAHNVVAYYSPRVLTGGKLALRGVVSSAYPLNMNEYAAFAPVIKQDEVTTGDKWATNINPGAMTPIVFLNETTGDGLSFPIEFLVTMEVRVRFSPLNPATASHSYHAPMGDSAWNDLIKCASSIGHGVMDIVETVADAGALATVGAALA